MKQFLLALQFLTIIPVRIKEVAEENIAQSMIFFPAVGLLLGVILCACDGLLSQLGLIRFCADTLLVGLLIILTGAIHLDGLADTVDAFASGKDKDGMLRVMRDSNIGTMGALSLILALLIKIGLISSLASAKYPALILMCVLSRWAQVCAVFFLPYARGEGKAKLFIKGMNRNIFIFAGLSSLGIIFIAWRIKAILVFVSAAAFTWVCLKCLRRKFGGATGDTIGAISELAEIVVLFSVIILEGG
ncbi:MAG: adenosylcobinamide-GDP ribazoletransferase [Candidatus Omnitrophica bacterium CG11_big_fil_rev_8_21_14_0_20_42_13]|uniref:Adenosylcobinamide-GDP ribazoletransferase n=1 Tax=Candidatus Ghiorseimicrobium undicola TaxID=1974746 RepID=A0A2H0LZR2_9BACT|nr:MAG: adenosylcobinamide-GDP ribazoletransferase [Candidatus Omnitrophica bacterium CG11_big_fil_rev_8_21_14_0_20_42_13]